MQKENKNEMSLYDIWKVLVKRKKLFLGVFVISVVCAVAVSLLTPKVYRGEATLQLVMKDFTVRDLLGIVGTIDSDNIKGILPKTHRLVSDMNVIEVKNSDNKLRILVYARNPKDIPDILAEFLESIKNNPAVMSLTVPQKEILLKKIEELSALIKSSEEIQKTYDKLLRQGKTGDIGFDPIDIKEKIYNFQMGYRELKHELDNLQRIILVGTPYISERPVKPKLKMNVALAAIFGVFGGIFAAFLLEHIENIRSGRRD